MHIRLLNYILDSKIKTWILIISTGAVFYILNFIWPVPELTRLWQGSIIPDLMPFGASTEYIQNLLTQLWDSGRSQYLIFLITLDILFPILYSLFFGILLWISIRHIHLSDQIKWMLASLPFIAACFDYIENISMFITLSIFPSIYPTVIHIWSVATVYKNIFSYIGLSILIWFGVYHIIRKIYTRNK